MHHVMPYLRFYFVLLQVLHPRYLDATSESIALYQFVWYITVPQLRAFSSTFNYPPKNPMSQLSPRSLRKLHQAVESRAVAIRVKEDDKPADKVPE